MKAILNFKHCSVEVEGETQRDLFENLHSMGEVFGEDTCGKCQSNDLRFVVRSDDEDNKYYELWCQECRAKKTFGCHKKGGGLFPHRKDKEDNYLPDGGWMRWNKEKNVLE